MFGRRECLDENNYANEIPGRWSAQNSNRHNHDIQCVGAAVHRVATRGDLIVYSFPKLSRVPITNFHTYPPHDSSWALRVSMAAVPVPGVLPVFFLAASSCFSCSMFLT